jgi:hypothetical protein
MKPKYNNRYVPQEQHVQSQLLQQQQYTEGDVEPTAKISFLGEAHSELGVPAPIQPEAKAEEKPEAKAEEKPEAKAEEKIEEKPDFTKPTKKPTAKEKPEDSIANLRKAKDDAETKYKALSEEIQSQLGTNDVTILKPVVDYLNRKLEGIVTPEKVSKLIEDFDGGDQRIKDYEDKIQDREKRLRDYDIRESEEFKVKYQAPWQEAQNSLFYEFANVTPDKKLIAPKATNELFEAIAKNAEIDPPTMKSLLRQFEISYEKESGEKTSLPSLTDMMKAHRNFQQTRVDMQKAYQNWEVEKVASRKENELKTIEAEKELSAKNKRERVRYATEAFRNFNHDDFDGLIEDDELKVLFDEEYKFNESYWEQGKPPATLSELYQRGVNDRILKRILPEYKELKKFKEEYDKGENNEIRGSGGGAKTKQRTSGANFLGEAAETLAH